MLADSTVRLPASTSSSVEDFVFLGVAAFSAFRRASISSSDCIAHQMQKSFPSSHELLEDPNLLKPKAFPGLYWKRVGHEQEVTHRP